MCKCLSHNGFLTSEGFKEAALRGAICNGVDGTGASPYLDRVGSVSGLELERDPFELDDRQTDEQYRRFHNGTS